jgi:hypothetical protein
MENIGEVQNVRGAEYRRRKGRKGCRIYERCRIYGAEYMRGAEYVGSVV